MIPTLAVQEIHDTIPGMRPSAGAAPKSDDPSWQITITLGHYQGLHRRIDELEDQCAMLARRCAEQARHIAGLLELKAEEAAEAHPLADAIAVMQSQGVR